MDKRKMRVTQDHWRLILDYAEVHSEIITNKFPTHLQGRQNFRYLWEELANKLNSLGQGNRSVEEWKKTVADWKSKTKKKASQNSKQFTQTGGGPADTTPLTILEEKLISIMGHTVIFGDGSASERGIKRKISDIEASKMLDVTEEIVFDDLVDVTVEDLHDHTYIKILEPTAKISVQDNVDLSKYVDKKATPAATRTASTSARGSSGKKDIHEMHTDVLHVLKSIEGRLEGMDNSMKRIANSLEIIANHLLK